MSNFVCNITGIAGHLDKHSFSREGGSIPGKIPTTVRWRQVIYLLSVNLFKKEMVLANFPVHKNIKGLGMTDEAVYSKLLEEKFDYTNTYYHRKPYFDIKNPDPTHLGKYDFVITSDVFEHIDLPIDVAFQNLYKILKPGGFVIFTVPWVPNMDNTIEHFPDIYKWNLVNKGNKYILENTTKEGKHQTYDNLVFHGGSGQNLEMRLFSKKALLEHFTRVGFKKIDVIDYDVPLFGIINNSICSLPIVAYR